jgi:hypothetical protein
MKLSALVETIPGKSNELLRGRSCTGANNGQADVRSRVS